MASGWTNHGKWLVLSWFRGVALPTNFYVALCDQTTAPTADTDTKGTLTECPNGNGYTTGGISLTKNATDFDTLTEVDASDWSLLQVKDLVWTASGGNLPASGTGARWAVLTDDNATQGSRIVIAYYDLVSNRIVSDTQTLTLQDVELRLTE